MEALAQTLDARSLLRLPAGSRLACDSGSLWITEDHQLQDTVLQAGQQFRPSSGGALLVYALTPARLRRLA